ncbi:hypothetical protein N7466_000830 [Penicillium verhagenii]|uniref:uncharacterized protein n=1 Tax=Penicillium verhagenii TaxID=1562060 RepID=UPI002544EB66|nr:uncharacterized protein N7466_000830 [Penicillium verhagenii]KAJ5947815.1 hypothetical protein N7466_000830 [Penicillium verhagenii]
MAGPRQIKDAPMACPAASIQSYTAELWRHRDACLAIFKSYEEKYTDAFWGPNDEDAEKPDSGDAKARLKLSTQVVLDDGKRHFPPPFTRLSDELVYLATKFLKATDRGRDYPYDFLPRGDIDPERVPSGVGPIVWAHGLPFFPVYKGYYILCGREHAKWIGWWLHPRTQNFMRSYPIWTIGPVVAPGSAVELERSIERQLFNHKTLSAKDCEKGMEKAPPARDVMSDSHIDGSVVPMDSKDSFTVAPIYRLRGYSIKVGPITGPHGKKVLQIRKSYFSLYKVNVKDFDWDAVSKRAYANEKHPQLYEDDESEKDTEVMADATDSNGSDSADDMDETRDGDLSAPEEANTDDEMALNADKELNEEDKVSVDEQTETATPAVDLQDVSMETNNSEEAIETTEAPESPISPSSTTREKIVNGDQAAEATPAGNLNDTSDSEVTTAKDQQTTDEETNIDHTKEIGNNSSKSHTPETSVDADVITDSLSLSHKAQSTPAPKSTPASGDAALIDSEGGVELEDDG